MDRYVGTGGSAYRSLGHTGGQTDMSPNINGRRSSRSSSTKMGVLQLLSLPQAKLVKRKDLPFHLQFNPYIETGYRPLLTLSESVLSLFYFHNETVNIITHAVPMVYIFVYWQSLLPWSQLTIPLLPWTHLVGAVSPWVGSTIYHLFMNHKHGEKCYNGLLHLDMFGIWLTQSCGALTTIYASVSCLEMNWIRAILGLYVCVSLWCLYKALTAHTTLARRLSFSYGAALQLAALCLRVTALGGGHPSAPRHYLLQAVLARTPVQRRLCFGALLAIRLVTIALRWMPSGGGHPDAFPHIIMQDLMAVIGGFIGALRVPEKWLPGRLDLVANSHHIMHVVVVYAVYHLHQGAVLDLLWLSNDNRACHGALANNSTSFHS